MKIFEILDLNLIFTQLPAGSDPATAARVAGDAEQDCSAVGQCPRTVATDGSHGSGLQGRTQHEVTQLFV